LAVSGSGVNASFTVPGTGGSFLLTYDTNTLSQPLTVGVAPSAVQSALIGLLPSGVSATVTQSGSTYSIVFTAGGDESKLSGQVVLPGTVAHTTTAADFATQLQSAATAALAKAGDSSITVTATLNGSGFLVIGQQHSTPGLVLSFPHPIVAQGGSGFGSRISLTPSGFTFTPGAGQSPINRSRTVQVNLDNPADPYAHPISSNVAFQELGLLSTPTPFTFTHANTTPDV